MKNITSLLTALLFISYSFISDYANAQAPAKMSYQTVIRNGAGSLITNQSVGIKISILQTSSTGTAVYIETHAVTSNANGLVSLQIGGGTVVFGTMAGINWGAGPYFVKTETDPTGGTNYTITGTSELLSVPYALHAGNVTAGNWLNNGNDINNANSGNVGIGTVNPTAKLDVTGLIKSGVSGTGLEQNNGTISVGTYIDASGGWLGTNSNHPLYFYTNYSNQLMTLDTAGNFGIGTTAPVARLDVAGNIKITDGTEGAGKVLTSDASGIASWQPAQSKCDFSANLYGAPAFVMANSIGYLADFGTITYIDNLTYANGVITVPENGLYHFDMFVAPNFGFINNINLEIQIKVNGGLYRQHFSNSLSTDIKLNSGDQVTFELFQNSGVSQTMGPFSYINCHKVY